MDFTVAGSALTKCSSENGRNRRTFSTPTFAPSALSHSTVSWAISAPVPMTTMTRSASGCPTYSNRWYERPMTSPKRAMAASTWPGQAV